MGQERKRPPTRILERLFAVPEDLNWAMAFVLKFVANSPAAVRAEVVGETGANNVAPTIIVIHKTVVEDEKNEMVRIFNNCQNVLGRDEGRLRFEVTTVDEASIDQDRENFPKFVGKKVMLLWERSHEPVPAA